MAGRYRIDGATYIVSLAPSGVPSLLTESGPGFAGGLVAFLAEKLAPAQAGFTVIVRRRKGVGVPRSVLRRDFDGRPEAEVFWYQLCRDLHDGRLHQLED